MEHGYFSTNWETYSHGDVVGCGLVRLQPKENVIFFTKNGVLFDECVPIGSITGKLSLLPTIGLWGSFVKVKANIGQEPFVFTNWKELHELKTKVRTDCVVTDYLVDHDVETEVDIDIEFDSDEEDDDDDEEWMNQDDVDENEDV